MKEKNVRIQKEIEEEVNSENIFTKKINEQHKYLQTALDTVYNTCTDYILETEFCIGGEISYLTVSFTDFGKTNISKLQLYIYIYSLVSMFDYDT